MILKKIHALLGLLIILALFYFFNIFSLNQIANTLAEHPVKLSLTIVNPSDAQCDNCFDVKSVVRFITSTDEVKIVKKKTLAPESSEYNSFIENIGIKNLPAVVVSGDISDARIAKMLQSLSGEMKNGNIVVQDLLPYYDLKAQKKRGLVDVVMLKDTSCKECLDVGQYVSSLKRFGVAVASSSIYDIASLEGKSYIERYNIKKVPTMLLSPSAKDYPWFGQSWKRVGTIESDGWFVFRDVQSTGGKFSEI